MLRELPNVKQVAGEPKRRWFFCHEIDLVVWEDEDGNVCGFQLAYDKHRNEHSFSWNKDRGFAHYVDDGEPSASVNNTPFLYANGPFKRDRVLEQPGSPVGRNKPVRAIARTGVSGDTLWRYRNFIIWRKWEPEYEQNNSSRYA